MTEINIPVSIAGPGSQPAEIDGAELDILQMPSGMETYDAPLLPEPEEVANLDAGINVLHSLLAELQSYRVGQPTAKLDLQGLDKDNRELVDQALGEGEVSIVFTADEQIRIQESVLAGVWRVRVLDEDKTIGGDFIEVAAIPALVRKMTFAHAADVVDDSVDVLPEGVLNAPALLAEINEKVDSYISGAQAHVINLTLLPQTEQDLLFLADRLGVGAVQILSRGYGNCRVSSTATKNVWWVQYYNSQDKNILNSLEITGVPNVACAAQEDIDDSAQRLDEILEIYR